MPACGPRRQRPGGRSDTGDTHGLQQVTAPWCPTPRPRRAVHAPRWCCRTSAEQGGDQYGERDIHRVHRVVARGETLPDHGHTRPWPAQRVMPWCLVLTSGHRREWGRCGGIRARGEQSLTGSDLQEHQHREREPREPPPRAAGRLNPAADDSQVDAAHGVPDGSNPPWSGSLRVRDCGRDRSRHGSETAMSPGIA
jgi:hypothetical protein